MNIKIRQLQSDELLETLFLLNQYAFHPSPPFQKKEDWMALVRGRRGLTCFAAFDDDQPVSIAVSSAMTQNMRGMLYPASGVWGVATSPAARRMGCCKQVMSSLLAAEYESGKVFSNLYPFRESFYGRMGYVSFPLIKIARLAPHTLAPLLKMDFGGTVELKLIGEAFETYRSYLAEMRPRQHGMAFFDYGDPSSANRNLFWAAMARFGDQLEGFMLYSLKGEEVSKFQFVANRFYYRTSRARYLLLNWIARHVDQADRVEIWLPADEYPETWLVDTQVKVESPVRAAMGRILNVEMLGGMSVGEGEFYARITDPFCPWNEGAWKFESRQGKLRVVKTSSAECELTIQGLTALVAGMNDPQEFALRGWGNPEPACQAVMRQMMPAQVPFLHEVF